MPHTQSVFHVRREKQKAGKKTKKRKGPACTTAPTISVQALLVMESKKTAESGTVISRFDQVFFPDFPCLTKLGSKALPLAHSKQQQKTREIASTFSSDGVPKSTVSKAKKQTKRNVVARKNSTCAQTEGQEKQRKKERRGGNLSSISTEEQPFFFFFTDLAFSLCPPW